MGFLNHQQYLDSYCADGGCAMAQLVENLRDPSDMVILFGFGFHK